jgi:hypothetical protein
VQFSLVADGVVILNPGSVGQPRDGDPRAAYAVIDDGTIELKRIAYPIEETVAHLEATRLPERAKQMYRECLRLGRLPHPAPGGGARRMSRPDRVGPAYLILFASLYALQGVVVAYFFNYNQGYMEAAGVPRGPSAGSRRWRRCPWS